jgi:hypothetical protein
LRYLATKPDWELHRLVAEADHTKRLITMALDVQRTDGDVAEMLRGGGVRSEREE